MQAFHDLMTDAKPLLPSLAPVYRDQLEAVLYAQALSRVSSREPVRRHR